MKKLFLAAVAFTFVTACAHVSPTPNAMTCLAALGEVVVADVVVKIYTIIDNGTAAGDTEAQILAALKDAGSAYAPALWQCAMLFVSNPDGAAKSITLKGAGPRVTTKSAAAAIANDYLNGGAQ